MTVVLIDRYYKNVKITNQQSMVEMSFIAFRLLDVNIHQHEQKGFVKALDELSAHAENITLTDKPSSKLKLNFDNAQKQSQKLSYSYIKGKVLQETKDYRILTDYSLYLSEYKKWLNVHFPSPFVGLLGLIVLIAEGALAVILLYFLFLILHFVRLWQQMMSSDEYRLNKNNTKTFSYGFKRTFTLFYSIKAIKHMFTRIKELTQEKTFIITALTHNIRTPITRAELILEMQADTKEKSLLLQELDEINKQVTQIVSYAKSTQNFGFPDKVNLYAFIEYLINKTQYYFCVENRVDKKLSINAQPIALELAFNNIIDNAIKYAGHLTIYGRFDGNYNFMLIFESEISLQMKDRDYESSGLGMQISTLLLKQNDCQLTVNITTKHYQTSILIPKHRIVNKS
ncbi:ATP-binding protein [Facilibium subflavum]|uniref:ATP-binding protein n=1 Tax=Facilibium subflavum TaxID=2219058 RepID=UPI001AADC555|nr:sensor histidine kinase [Facilibium subflavum]